MRTNLAFGPQSHLIHLLAQCALKGSVPYGNLADANIGQYAPVHTDDIAEAVGFALNQSQKGVFNLNGSKSFNLNQINQTLAQSAGSSSDLSSPLFTLTYFWDLMVGTTSDINMSRMVEFYEQNPALLEEFSANPWTHTGTSVDFEDYYKQNAVNSSDYALPAMHSYKRAHTN